MYLYFVVLWNVAKLQCKKGKVYIYTLSDGQRSTANFGNAALNVKIMKSLNERVKELVSQVILDSEYEKLKKASKDITTELDSDPKYVELKKAADAYKWNKFVNDKDYQKIVRGCLFSAFRAASKCIKDVNVPFNYMEDEKNLTKVATTFLCDTDARIASAVCKVNEWFKPTKVTRSVEFIPYTIAEIRKLVELIQIGILEREKVREQIREGKRKR